MGRPGEIPSASRPCRQNFRGRAGRIAEEVLRPGFAAAAQSQGQEKTP